MKTVDLTPKNQESLPQVQPEIDKFINLGAEFFNISREILVGEGKTRNVADARRIISAEILERAQAVEIEHLAHSFNKTRVGIYHGINNIQQYASYDADLQKQVQDFKDFLDTRL